MASSDWDADSDDGAPAAAAKQNVAPPKRVGGFGRKKFEDEDVEDEIKDDWEEDDDEPAKPDVSSLQPIKKKGTVKQKIKEREEQERRRAELGLGSEDEDDEEDEQMDLAERRRMEKEAQIKADVENAANLLGTAKMASDEGASSLKPAKLSTKEDWEAFSDDIYRTVVKAHSSKPGFDRFFVPHFAKLLAENLRDVDCRKQSTHWKTIADEKTKLEKEKKAGGAKTKTAAKPKTVGTSSAKNTIDMRSYGDEALDDGDDLDFM